MPMIQVAENHYVDAADAKRRGLKLYTPRAKPPIAPKSAAGRRAVPPPRPAPPPARPAPPANIALAMKQGLSNIEINCLVAAGKLTRPSVARAMLESWPNNAWRTARQRGLIW